MGHRTVKRVPLNFDHPTGKRWPGYVSPQPRPCPAGDDCHNGRTATGAWLDNWVSILLIAASYDDHPSVPRGHYDGTKPDRATMAEFTKGLAGRGADRPFGHDAIDRWKAQDAIREAAGVDAGWGVCPACEGNACHPDDVDIADDWEPTDPPAGEGWQLWETTSEGSPVSPVFASAEALAEWCEGNATWFGSMTGTRDEWLRSFERETTDVDSLLTMRVSATEQPLGADDDRPERHARHARTCWCLNDSATCCDPTCCQPDLDGASDDE